MWWRINSKPMYSDYINIGGKTVMDFIYRIHSPFSTVPVNICRDLDSVRRLFCSIV